MGDFISFYNITPDPALSRQPVVRLSIALLIGGGIVFGSHALVLDKYTNPSLTPAICLLLVYGLAWALQIVFLFRQS
jgi:hypothetical protein